jgi:hypothetical protein
LTLGQIVDVFHPGPLRQLGIYIAKDLVTKDPGNPIARRLLSDDCFAVWQYSHSQVAAAAAIDAEVARLKVAHATPAQIAGNLRIDQIKHYVDGQSDLILSPLNLQWYKQRLAKYPDDWGSWLQVCGNYYERWRISRSKADASAAIDAYQHVLAVGPKDDSFQSEIKTTIAEIKSGVPIHYVYKKGDKSE